MRYLHLARAHLTGTASPLELLVPSWPAGADWARLKPRLYDHGGVVYAKQPLGDPEAGLEYLGRDTHRVAISNKRIFGIDAEQVVFRVRVGAGRGKKTRYVYQASNSSTASCCMCCPPASSASAITGYSRGRASAPAWRPRGRQLDVPMPSSATVESVADFLRRVARIEHHGYSFCGAGQMHVVARLPPALRALHLRGSHDRGAVLSTDSASGCPGVRPRWPSPRSGHNTAIRPLHPDGCSKRAVPGHRMAHLGCPKERSLHAKELTP